MDFSPAFPLLVEETESCSPLWHKEEGAVPYPWVLPNVGDSLETLGASRLLWENLNWSTEQLMGDNPEEKSCPAFAPKTVQQRARKFGAVFLPFQGTPGCPSWAVPLCHVLCRAGVTQLLIDLMLLRTQAGMQLGFLGQEGVRTLFFPFL